MELECAVTSGTDTLPQPAAAVGGTPAHDAPAAALFPHLYGGIKLSSVVEETPVDRTPSGKFMGILCACAAPDGRTGRGLKSA